MDIGDILNLVDNFKRRAGLLMQNPSDEIAARSGPEFGAPSRNWRILTPDQSTSGQWVVGKWPGGGAEQKYFDNAADAQAYYDKNNTSNYVLFDDALAKILGRE